MIMTKEQLKAYWNNHLNTNGMNSITGSLLNTGGVDIIDSMEPRGYNFPLSGNVPTNEHFQWDGAVLAWNDSADGSIELPYDQFGYSGYRMHVYNNSAVNDLTLTSNGTINIGVMKPGERALLIASSQNDWIVLMYAKPANHVEDWYEIDYVFDVDITDTFPDWTTLGMLDFTGVQNGIYEFKWTIAYTYSSTSSSVGMRYSLDGGSTWYEGWAETKDRTDLKVMTIIIPFSVTSGEIHILTEITKESSSATLDLKQNYTIAELKKV